jgi:hypothetical protein
MIKKNYVLCEKEQYDYWANCEVNKHINNGDKVNIFYEDDRILVLEVNTIKKIIFTRDINDDEFVLCYVSEANKLETYYHIKNKELNIKALNIISKSLSDLDNNFNFLTGIVLKNKNKDKILFEHIDIYDEIITEVIVNINNNIVSKI